MANSPPPIDPRTAIDIAEQTKALLAVSTPDWKAIDPATGQVDQVSRALIGVFARFSEIVIQRLNQVPQKNFLAFLNLLGASRLPPQSARVPLTFSLAAGSTTDAIVPAGTQVAAPPAPGDKDPVMFETERDLVVTAAQLDSVFVRDPEQDLFGDYRLLTQLTGDSTRPVFRGNRSIPHRLYLGHQYLLSFPNITNLSLTVTLTSIQQLQDARELRWQILDRDHPRTITPTTDTTGNLRQPSETLTFDLRGQDAISLTLVNGVENRWLCGQLLTPIARSLVPGIASDVGRRRMVGETQLPQIEKIEMQVDLARTPNQVEGLLPDLAFANVTPIDVKKPFLPFGDKPKLNDTLYFASAEAFSKDGTLAVNLDQGAQLDLAIDLANPWTFPSATSVDPAFDLQLAWECWNGSAWDEIGTTTTPTWLHLLELDPLPAVLPAPTDPTNQRVPVVTIQGTSQRQVTLNITRIGSDVPIPVAVGADSRFTTQIPLNAGLNIISANATPVSGTPERAWIVIFRETLNQQGQPIQQTIQLSVTPPSLPIRSNTDSIELLIAVSGDRDTPINLLRVTNGSLPLTADNPRSVARNVNGSTPVKIALSIGRNDVLIEGLSDGRVVAATTLTLVREANPNPDPASNGFADGTYGLRQSGRVKLRLPKTVLLTLINGQENFWLRARIKQGDYGKDASYQLKNPLNPSEGYTLTLATFRPPMINQIRIGYQHSLKDLVERCFTENNLEFVDRTLENRTPNQSFPAFYPAPDASPTLYFGFLLPPSRLSFPNRPLSVFCRTADVKYGERSRPISPAQSRAVGTASQVVTHQFLLTHSQPSPTNFEIAIFGTVWDTALQTTPPTATGLQTVTVQVTIPNTTASVDRGFLKFTQRQSPTDPPVEYTATFETFKGDSIPEDPRLQVTWQYWNGQTWVDVGVRDDAEAFTHPGLVEWLPAADILPKSEFGLSRYWFRVIWQQGHYAIAPQLQRVLLNTTLASQTTTIRNEILGSSDGTENQKFRSARFPILAGQQLDVRESDLPSAEEQSMIRQAEGNTAIVPVEPRSQRGAPATPAREVWVRWHQVSDFFASGVRDRHYTLDPITGEIQFGNGSNGLIPPIGIGNIRLTRYQTGGGVRGNQSANTIVQLKTTVPYVEKVTNPAAAAGGAEAESLAALSDRVPQTIRHRDRAVTIEDYEDLAKLASPEVARAQCVPLRNLLADPFDGKAAEAGEVSVIIVPRSTDRNPLPSLELISRVQDYLAARSLPTLNVSVVGALYLQVSLTVEIALVSLEGASEIAQSIEQRLTAFLHPLTGGLEGTGWAFGREPHTSDFYRLLEEIPGVDHVRSLRVKDGQDSPDPDVRQRVQAIKATNRFLVYSGSHQITLTLGEPL